MSTDYDSFPFELVKILDPINMSITILAVLLNVFLGIINFRRWRSFSNDLLLIQLASYSDITFSTSLLGVQILKLMKGPTVLLDHNRVCQITGMTVMATAGISLTCVMLIGLLRYFAIVKGLYYKNKLWSFVVLGVVVVWFTIGGIAAKYNLFKMMSSGTYCFVSIDSNYTASKLLGIFIFLYLAFMDLILILNYMMITNQYLLYSDHLMTDSPELTLILEKKKIKIKMILLILAYQIVLMPSVVVGLIGIFWGGVRSPIVDGVTATCINLVTIVNPICIMSMHDDTKKEIRRSFQRDRLFVISDNSNTNKYELYPMA